MFHLIEFSMNKAVAVVPQSWYSDGVVYWPNYRNDERVNRAVKNAEEPGADWDLHDVRLLKSCGQYHKARRHLNKLLSCNTSDLQSEEEEEEETRPKRKLKPIYFLGHSADDGGEEDQQKKRVKGQPKPSQQTQMEYTRPTDLQSPSAGCRRGSSSEAHIISLLEHIKHQQDQLFAKVNYLISRVKPTASDMEMPVPVQFPLTSMEEVKSLEDWLRDPAQSQMKQSLSSTLAAIGGHDTKRVTWNILAHMFHDDVGKQINWKGVNGKKAFSQMASKTLLLNSVRQNAIACASTEHDVCQHAIRWFNLAADRGSSRRRAQEVLPADDNTSV